MIPIENSLAGSVTEHFDLLLAREGFHPEGISSAHRAQPDRRAGSEDRRFAASLFASGGAGAMPRFFPEESEDSGDAVL